MGEQDCDCNHDKEIILLIDHVKDIGVDTKVHKDAIHGNGRPGLLTRTALNEQSIKTLAKFQWMNMAAILGAAVKIVFFGG